MFDKHTKVFCASCGGEISPLYMKCADCDNIELCLKCFSSGIELQRHLKTHKYTIIDNGTFALFDATWSAEEEQALLESVEQHGLGNWDEVASNIPTKSAKEVEDHYNVVYIEGYLGRVTVPADIPNRMTDHTPPIHESVFSVPLPQVDVSKEEQEELAYMPNRDDFEQEFDNDAESVVSSLFMNQEDNELDKGLKLAKVGIYHARLNERQRRKDIAREYKLIEKFFNKDKKAPFVTKYEREARLKFRPCSQFMKREQFDKLIDGLIKERQLKRKITKFKTYRKYGVTKFEGCAAFDSALYKRERKKTLNEGKESHSGLDRLHRPGDGENAAKAIDPRRQPEYSMLGNGERTLCLNMKITPSKYMTAKVLVVKDCIMKQQSGQNKPRYSNSVEKSQRKRILNFLKENQWAS